MTGPKIWMYDIENAPALGYFWPPGYDTNIITVKEEPYCLSFAGAWYNPDGLDPDDIVFERKAMRKGDDKGLMRKLWKYYDEADAVMAHNGDRFDQKKALSRMVKHGFPPPSPYIEIDTLKLSRQKFAFTSNKLDNLARFLDIGEKKPHQGMHTWYGCMENDPEAWADLEEYNKHDVVLMDGVYRCIAPYVRTRLNMQAWTGTFTCVKCGSRNLEGRGYASRGGTDKSHRQWRCLEPECGKYSYELLSETGRMRSV